MALVRHLVAGMALAEVDSEVGEPFERGVPSGRRVVDWLSRLFGLVRPGQRCGCTADEDQGRGALQSPSARICRQ